VYSTIIALLTNRAIGVDTADINIVRHFPVSDRSDQSNDLPHLLSFRGYRNETDATSVPPHIRFPVTSHVTSESSHRVDIQTRDTAGSRELEKEGGLVNHTTLVPAKCISYIENQAFPSGLQCVDVWYVCLHGALTWGSVYQASI